MDENAKKKALLMIPYGLFVLGARHGDKQTVATVNCPPGTGSCTVTASITQANPSDEADVASTRRAPVLG